MKEIKVLWADDEIELLKPHVMFLEEKGYLIDTVNNGSDALDQVNENQYDIVLLDENMPGLTGLETLTEIKTDNPTLPVIMVTKSEEESIMEDAIGSKISDYLIKPVNPKQLLLSLKKNLDDRRLISEKTTSNYMQEFRKIGRQLGDNLDCEDWKELYEKLIFWDLELERSGDESMKEIFRMQKEEANNQFAKFIDKNYADWLTNSEDAPLLSHQLFRKRIAPEIGSDSVFMVLIDNLRFDQWKVIKPVLEQYFRIDQEEMFYSILPTATQFARNAIFAGLMPSEIQKKYPKLWVNDDEEGGKNMHEHTFLEDQMKRLGKNVKHSYNKITNHQAGKKLADNFNHLLSNTFNVIVYNFVDMLSHARTEMEMIRELADDDAAYRSITLSWFNHSPLLDIIKKIADSGSKLIITTDHGTIHVNEPSKVIGDRNTNTNLRYKHNRNLTYEGKDVLVAKNPDSVYLPSSHFGGIYIFAKSDKFFAYPNNYNHYVKYYKNTFQHGGISLEEMLIPFAILSPK